MEKKLSAEEVLNKNANALYGFNWQKLLTAFRILAQSEPAITNTVKAAMEEYASQFRGEAVSDAVECISVEDRLPEINEPLIGYKDEAIMSKDEWNESEQAIGTATIHLSDNDPRWGKTVSEGAQFIFHKMADGTINFEVYAPNGLNDQSNFDGVFNQTTTRKLKEFLNDKTTY